MGMTVVVQPSRLEKCLRHACRGQRLAGDDLTSDVMCQLSSLLEDFLAFALKARLLVGRREDGVP
jgi:hypothetical protein